MKCYKRALANIGKGVFCSPSKDSLVFYKTLATKGKDQRNPGKKIAKESWLTIAVVLKTRKSTSNHRKYSLKDTARRKTSRILTIWS